MSASETAKEANLQSVSTIWEWLPPRTRMVLQDAIQYARGQTAVEPQHLLFALLRAPRSGAQYLLRRSGADLKAMQERVAEFDRSEAGSADDIYYSSSLMQTLDQARSLSESLGRSYISTSHLLMALAASDLPVGRLMCDHGLTPARLKRCWRKWQRESNLRRRWALGLEAASVFRPVMPRIPSFKTAAALAGIPWKVLARKSLLHPGYRTDPFRMYRYLRQERPFALDPLLPAFVAVNYKDVQFIIKDTRFGRAPFISDGFPVAVRRQLGAPEGHRGLPAMMLFADPPRHTRIRSAFMRVFNTVPMELIRSRLTLTIQKLLDRMAVMDRFDVIEEFSGPLPTMVITGMMGLPEGDAPKLAAWSDRMVPAIGIHSSLEDLTRADAAYAEFSDYLQQKLAENPKEGMLGALLDGDAAELPQEEFIANCMLLLMAGHETTTSLITNGILLLLRHPDQRAAALRDEKSMAAAVEEILRFESPVQWTGRVAMTDVTLNGHTICRGDLVLAGIGAANRDPAVFSEPERFNVERTENRHIAFGFGIHYCLGAMLAKLEAQIALTGFFRRFPHAAIAQESLHWQPGLVLRCPEKLIVRPT
ncbi:MAG: cytochrome P450 [Phycisphaerae bacterium]